jgi:outer membrane protein assembly factor BamB
VPIVAVINGERLLISGGGDGGVHAFKVRTGEKVWSYIFGTGAVNCSPVVQGDLVFIGHGEENEGNTQGRVICVDAGKVTNGKPNKVWQVDGIKVKFASPVLDRDRLYVCDELGALYCLSTKDGSQIWVYNYGKNTKGSPVLADGKIYIPEADARFHILKPNGNGCQELHSQFFRKKAGGADVALNGSPAVCNNRVYFMTSDELYCIGKKDGKKGSDPIPQSPAEGPPSKDA